MKWIEGPVDVWQAKKNRWVLLIFALRADTYSISLYPPSRDWHIVKRVHTSKFDVARHLAELFYERIGEELGSVSTCRSPRRVARSRDNGA